MSANRPQPLNMPDQSLWLDGLRRRQLLPGGELQQLVEQAGVCGVTTYPASIERAIGESHEYDEAIGRLARQSKSAEEIYEALLEEDVTRAADILRPLYERTAGGDGFVCLPVAPSSVGGEKGTLTAARRWWARLHRPNIMLLVAGTREELPAVQQLVSEGINVNVTLLCSVPRYEEVAEAYVTGLHRLLARGRSLARVASVASFCLRRSVSGIAALLLIAAAAIATFAYCRELERCADLEDELANAAELQTMAERAMQHEVARCRELQDRLQALREQPERSGTPDAPGHVGSSTRKGTAAD